MAYKVSTRDEEVTTTIVPDQEGEDEKFRCSFCSQIFDSRKEVNLLTDTGGMLGENRKNFDECLNVYSTHGVFSSSQNVYLAWPFGLLALANICLSVSNGIALNNSVIVTAKLQTTRNFQKLKLSWTLHTCACNISRGTHENCACDDFVSGIGS